MINYELAEKDYKNGMKYKDIATKYGVSLNTVKSWKTRYWNANKKKKVCTHNKKSTHTKKAKEVAKALIVNGASITEVSEQTGIPRGTLGNWSTQEKLQKKQLEYLKEFRDKYSSRVEENKLRRLTANEEALTAIEHELKNWRQSGKISKALMEKLIMNEQAEQLIFEVDRIERFEKNDVVDTQEDKVSKFLDILTKGLDD